MPRGFKQLREFRHQLRLGGFEDCRQFRFAFGGRGKQGDIPMPGRFVEEQGRSPLHRGDFVL